MARVFSIRKIAVVMEEVYIQRCIEGFSTIFLNGINKNTGTELLKILHIH